MRNAFAMASLLLAGCTILPDDSFKNIPEAQLQKITITSNTGKNPVTGGDLDPGEFPSLSAVAEVSTTSNTVELTWSGNLRWFWFLSPVATTEYKFNSDDLISSITLTTESGIFQTETLSYNEDGRIEKLESNYNDSFLAIYDFFYLNGKLDSISKYIEVDAFTDFAFFKRNYDAGPEQHKFIFIYPFNDYDDWNVEENDNCEPFQTTNTNIARKSYFTFSEGFQRFEAKIPIPDFDDYYYYNHSDLNYETSFSRVLGTVQRMQLFNKEDIAGCGPVRSLPVNYYTLLDPLNEDYQLLGMLDAAESMISITWEPERTTSYVDLTFDYEYTFTE